jgi:alpha-glucan,water dikinase
MVAREGQRLLAQDRIEPQKAALHARAIGERAARAVGEEVDALMQALQPQAESLGRALKIQEWVLAGFGEGVVRASPLFAISRILSLLAPLVHREAGLGAWELIGPGRAVGRVETASDLLAVQGHAYSSPTVLVVERVHGEEEIPSRVLAVLTLDRPDLVSHLAVRARNAHVLLATCHESKVWQELVGNKSCKLAELRRALPSLTIPPSFAIPAGVFQAVLDHASNLAQESRYQDLLQKLPTDPPPNLASLRQTILDLSAPVELLQELHRVGRKAGLDLDQYGDRVWDTLKRVWASQWNDRAYYARQGWGLDHRALRMAVLVQPVVAAEYGFVLHTVHPITREPDQLYGELVWGFGEALVGNHPGRALGFVAPRSSPPELVTYPSKSYALRAEGLIFRSDSNAEDLEGYSGAGLYDSVTTDPVRRELVDYAQARLPWDREYQSSVLSAVAALGRAVEQSLGAAQDVEGAWVNGEAVLLQARPQVGLE